MAIQLTDDGTLDTVLRCSRCGETMRYNYDGGLDVTSADALRGYREFVKWAKSDAADGHECGVALAPLEGSI